MGATQPNNQYVHVHTSTGGDEAAQAKEAFEAYAAQRGVYVKQYHGDNGIFKSDKWIQHCQLHLVCLRLFVLFASSYSRVDAQFSSDSQDFQIFGYFEMLVFLAILLRDSTSKCPAVSRMARPRSEMK